MVWPHLGGTYNAYVLWFSHGYSWTMTTASPHGLWLSSVLGWSSILHGVEPVQYDEQSGKSQLEMNMLSKGF